MKIRDGVLLNPRSVTAAAREPAGWLVWRGPWRRSVNPRGPRVCGAGLPGEFAAQPALFASLASTIDDTKMDCSAHPENYLHDHFCSLFVNYGARLACIASYSEHCRCPDAASSALYVPLVNCFYLSVVTACCTSSVGINTQTIPT